MRLDIRIQRQIIQYYTLNPSFSNRKIASMLSISHSSVGRVIALFHKCHLNYHELNALPNRAFSETLGTTLKQPHQSKKGEPDWDYVCGELKKRDLTLSLLWQEYRIDYPNGLSYSQYAKKYKQWNKTNRLSMRQHYKVGEQVLIDFCGRTMPIKNPITGEVRKVQVFVAVLGASSYIFAYAVESQKINDWLQCHIEMFRYFEGVPEQVVTDNLKSAVITNTKTRLNINQSYAELAEYYNFAINPTRPRKPQDKGLAEVSVQIVQRGILAKLRNHTFFSLDELNDAIALELIELNNKNTKRFVVSRYEQFEQYDKPYLNPVPEIKFELKNWFYSQRVDEFYQININGVRYSVPYQYAHKKVDIAVSKNLVEIYYQRQRIGSHPIASEGRLEVIDVSHMPKDHKYQAEVSMDYLSQWAQKLGDNAYLWTNEFLTNKRDYAQNLRKFRNLKTWVIENQFDNRLDPACKCAISMNVFNTSTLKNIIKSQSYLRFDDKDDQEKISVDIQHENVRGSHYYQNILQNNRNSGANHA